MRDATADTFKVSTTRDGPALDVSIAGSGYVTAVAVPSKPTPTWAYVLIGVAAVAVLALIVVFLPKDVTVPAIVGLSQADATATVEKDKLTLEVAGTEYSTVYPEGSVVVQYPEAGTRAEQGLDRRGDPLHPEQTGDDARRHGAEVPARVGGAPHRRSQARSDQGGRL